MRVGGYQARDGRGGERVDETSDIGFFNYFVKPYCRTFSLEYRLVE